MKTSTIADLFKKQETRNLDRKTSAIKNQEQKEKVKKPKPTQSRIFAQNVDRGGGGGTPNAPKKRKNDKKQPVKNQKQETSEKTIQKMKGWWVSYAEKSKLEKKSLEGLKRPNIGEFNRLPAMNGETRGSGFSNSEKVSEVLEHSTPRGPSELGNKS